jgi:hypothetical protein
VVRTGDLQLQCPYSEAPAFYSANFAEI